MQSKPIKAGIGTIVGIIVSVGALLPPLVTQLIALFENTSAHWSGAEKIAVISGAAIAAITMLGRFAQAVAAIIKGS